MRRPGRHTIPLAALLTGVSVWFWALVLTAAPTDPLPDTAASAFVPPDGTRTSVNFSQQDATGNAMLEHARLSGNTVAFAMSPSAAKAMKLPAGGLTAATYWREAAIPADSSQPTRYRIRTVEADGIHLRVQDWQRLGVSFENLLELPADVHAGQQWSSAGRAIADPITRQLHFRNESRAAAAGPDCLQVTSTTTLTAGDGTAPLRWQEQNRWCPGLGVVSQRGSFRGTAYEIVENTAPLGAIAADALTGPTFDATGRAGWTHTSSPVVAGDQTFGDVADPDPDANATPVMAANRVIAFPYAGTNDLVMLLPLNTGTFWQHWYGRPGGAVTSSVAIGNVVVVATTERTLVAYNAGGRSRWAAALDDVAVAAPIALTPTRLAVATVGGTLTVFGTTTSLPVWSGSTPNSVHNPIVGNQVAVVVGDTDGNLTAYDTTDGDQLWSADAASPFGSALAIDDDTVYVTSSGFVSAHDLRTGARRWTRQVGGGLERIARAGDNLLVENGQRIEAWSPADGRTRWTLPDTTLAGADLSNCLATTSSGVSFLLSSKEILAVTDDGRIDRRWSVQAPATAERTLHCADGRVWLIGRSADGSRPLSIESIGPR